MSTNDPITALRLREELKDKFLQENVIRVDPPSGPVHWSMWSKAPDNGFSLGHGIHYHDIERDPDLNVVALIRGFAWKQGLVVRGYYIQPDDITTAELIAALKQQIEALLAAKTQHYFPETWITKRIYARGNC